MDAALAQISQSSLKQNIPAYKVGQTVRIHQRIKEGEKERIQVFEGIIIKTLHGSGINGTITVRKIVDGIGVERMFAIHSSNIAKVEVTKEARVRRSKLYYLRTRTGKAARLKTTLLEGQVFEPKSAAKLEEEAAAKAAAEAPTEEPAKEEAPKAEETAAEEPVNEEAPAEEPAKEEAKEEVKEEAKAEEPAKEEDKGDA